METEGEFSTCLRDLKSSREIIDEGSCHSSAMYDVIR